MTSSDEARQLSPAERRLLAALHPARAPMPLAEAAAQAGFAGETEAFSAASWLQRKGLVTVEETARAVVTVGPEGDAFLRQGFPERLVYRHVLRTPDGMGLEELKRQFPEQVVQIALAWWKRKGLGRIEKRGGETFLVADPTAAGAADETFLNDLFSRTSGPGLPRPEAEVQALNPAAYQFLRSRPGVLDVRTVKLRTVALTDAGRALAAGADLTQELVGELTPELIQSGAWRNASFQAYHIGTAAPRPAPAKPHPLVQIIEKVRSIFVELGFQEIEDDYVQSAFWNMDALFIPQDHPAREMQDTFFLEEPASLTVDEALLAKISAVHRSGAGTGGRGWGARLDPEESRRALLRTHTTVGTIRHLAKDPKPPIRVFSIGRVFRHETMDATHLPEFHQIEGIATEKGADFPMLLGILQEFYRRLGFPQLRWRPAYFPYTEPSMEVEVWTGSKWMGLGGCGIFRPEVTKPLGIKTPVLAWGLGLERLAMMRLGLKDIRDLYVSDVDWLRRQPLL